MTEHGGEFVTARNVGEQTTRREFQLGRFGPFTFGLFRDGRVADVCREFELTNVTETAKRLDPDELEHIPLGLNRGDSLSGLVERVYRH